MAAQHRTDAPTSAAATVHALPSACFTSPRAMLRARRAATRAARAAAPLEVRAEAVGVYGLVIVATGTPVQLIDAGICTAEHLPQGAQRVTSGRAAEGEVEHWHARRQPGGRVRLEAHIRTHFEALPAPYARVRAAAALLAAEERADAAAMTQHALRWQLQVIDGAVGTLQTVVLERGVRVPDELQSIPRDIKALADRAARLVDSAAFEVDEVLRRRYLDDLRAGAAVAMPALPRLGVRT